MDLGTIFNIVIGVLIAGIGWFGKMFWAEVQHLKEQVNLLEIRTERDFVRTARFDAAFAEIIRKLDILVDRIADKADR